MNTLKRRGIRRAVISLGFVGLFVAFNAIPGAATAPIGFASQVLGRGTDMSRDSLVLKHGLDIVVAKITVAPGGSSGWHSHPGGAIAIVQTGELTVYASVAKGDDEQGQDQSGDKEGGRHPQCVITTYAHGQAFVELPGEVVDAFNTGSTDTVVVATFPGVPVGVVGGQRIDQPNPGTCGI